ncbi:MAG: hypothetical protein LBQ94_04020 [Treponema sp.]|nr:hypothetical protein [Treponema sp.]
MDNPLAGFRPKGELLLCFISFPRFRGDLEVLVREGYVKVTGPETCVWLKSKTSLAEYFRWVGKGVKGVTGGFWAPIENAFGIKRHTLRRLAGHNGNRNKNYRSRDFYVVEKMMKKYLEQKQKRQDMKYNYFEIKNLILEAENEDEETINRIMEKIGTFFTKNGDPNVDKNRKNRR